MSGKLIRLFLVDGNPNGLRTIEISNKTIYATIFPRTKLKEFLSRAEAQKPGSYILLGNSPENSSETITYIGEGEPVNSRLKAHAAGKNQKDFWNEAIVFTSKDDYITKTQIQYLESEIYRLVVEADKVKVDNAQVPSKPNLSEVDNSEMKDFLEGVKLILSSIGIDILESQKISKSEPDKSVEKIFNYTIKGAVAKMKIEEERFVVLKGSTAVIENQPSAQESTIKMRNGLDRNGVIKKNEDGTFFIFQEDYIFNSPTYAAAAIAGGSVSGRAVWKHNGMNLNQIEESELEPTNGLS